MSSQTKKRILKSKKSQVEIIGIAVVIVLLIIGLTFFVRFGQRRPDLLLEKSELDDKQLVTNLLNAMLATSTGNDCDDKDIKGLLKDCVDNPGARGSIVCSNGKPSCTFLDDILAAKFVEPVFGAMGKDYVLSIEGTEHIVSKNNSLPDKGCNAKRKQVIKSSPFIISGNFNTLILQLEVCYEK